MPEHTEKPRKIRSHVPEPEIAEHHGDRSFDNVADKRKYPRLFAPCAEHIRHYRVARAVSAYIVGVERARHYDGRTYAAEKISSRRAKQHGRYQPEKRRHADNAELFGKKAIKTARNDR